MRSIIFTSGPLCKPGPRYIDVIPNFELECELLGLAEGLKITFSNNIARQIGEKRS